VERPLHIAVFVDQHPSTLGGMQTSVRLQRRFLEAAGHRVTIVAPRLRREQVPDPGILTLPPVPLGPGEYSLTVPGGRTDALVDAGLAGKPPVDVVHVQADFWQAMIGYRFAERHALPVVHTMHNRLDVGLRATVPFPEFLQRVFSTAQRRLVPHTRSLQQAVDAWTYLAAFTRRAQRVTAPSRHFAQLLQDRGVFPAVDVVPNGLDDAVVSGLLASSRHQSARPRLAWVGRFSAEKRLLPFLEAVRISGIDADIHVFGDGGQRRRAEAAVRRIQTADVVLHGKVPYQRLLAELRASDVLVQTSQDFETQGMTVFEAAALGTPSILSDHRIAEDLRDGFHWRTPDDTVEGLARTLVDAVGDIRSGRARRNEGVGSAFLQSRQTAAMVEIYLAAMLGHDRGGVRR
jgi:1,2-diacylglycerol 3-alpha-glucosyltransferase